MSGDDAPPSPFLDRWVRVLADEACDGVFDSLGRACGVEDLPITPDMSARILGWALAYEDSSDEWGLLATFDLAGHAAEGLAVAKALKSELPDWTVVYFDEAAFRMGRPRRAYEYEVVLDATAP